MYGVDLTRPPVPLGMQARMDDRHSMPRVVFAASHRVETFATAGGRGPDPHLHGLETGGWAEPGLERCAHRARRRVHRHRPGSLPTDVFLIGHAKLPGIGRKALRHDRHSGPRGLDGMVSPGPAAQTARTSAGVCLLLSVRISGPV